MFQWLSDYREEIFSGFLVLSVVAILIFIFGFVIPKNIRQKQLKIDVCHPYRVAGSFTLEGERYVVCANKEQRLLVDPKKD